MDTSLSLNCSISNLAPCYYVCGRWLTLGELDGVLDSWILVQPWLLQQFRWLNKWLMAGGSFLLTWPFQIKNSPSLTLKGGITKRRIHTESDTGWFASSRSPTQAQDWRTWIPLHGPPRPLAGKYRYWNLNWHPYGCWHHRQRLTCYVTKLVPSK